MSLRDLPVLGSVTGAPSKPVRGADRIERRKTREKRAAAFRRDVWARDQSHCRLCGRPVIRTLDHLDPRAGHVHHLAGRRVAPDAKYDASKALLLCSTCHLTAHHQ